MTELYSHSKYKDFHLFVEWFECTDGTGNYYEGFAQLNGTTLYHNRRMLNGDNSEADLMKQIDDDQC